MYCKACNFDLGGLPSNTCPECGRAFVPDDTGTFAERPRSWLSRHLARIVLAIGATIVLAMLTGGYVIYKGVHIAMRAEERLQATRVVAELIAEHVEKSPTHAWPTSWADLEKIPHDGCMFRWPAQAAEYKAIVVIDFTATTASVLKQTPTTCTAVTVTPGPSFQGFPAMEMEPLFARLHELDARGVIPRQAPPREGSP